MENCQTQKIITVPTKSIGLSILLTFLFGPLGMLYSTIVGGIIMFIVSIIVFILTLGFGILITWPICVIWGAIAVDIYNKKLLSGTRQY